MYALNMEISKGFTDVSTPFGGDVDIVWVPRSGLELPFALRSKVILARQDGRTIERTPFEILGTDAIEKFIDLIEHQCKLTSI